MSKNIAQIYAANPSTVMADQDLLYIGISPYSLSNDSAIKWVDLRNSLISQLFTWSTDTAASVALLPNTGHFANSATLITYTLPSTAAVGTSIEIGYQGVGGWSIAQNAGQSIIFGDLTSTVGTGGSLSSNTAGDYVRIICQLANTTWIVGSDVGNLTLV